RRTDGEATIRTSCPITSKVRGGEQHMPPAGRLGDQSHVPTDAHGCPGCPHSAVGPAVAGSPNVFVNARPALRLGDPGIHAACCGANTWTAVEGSSTVFINGRPAHRLNDGDLHCGGMGRLVEGSPDVIVGGVTSSAEAMSSAPQFEPPV